MWIFINAMMFLIFLILGFCFYKSNGRATNYLAGYNTKSKEEREKNNENEMCKEYGKSIMFMALPFIAGIAIDYKFTGIGTVIAWVIWVIMFISLIIKRNKLEK